ncbi:MAG: hypothetical protein Q7T47_05205, partial [Anaerolineales bacterium]|nr:hypothetical protein [Anaerolineales bacterium]
MNPSRLLELDARLSAQLRVAERPGVLRTLAAILAHSGDSWFWLAGLILVVIFGEKTWKIWALILSGSILALAVF